MSIIKRGKGLKRLSEMCIEWKYHVL